MGQFPQQPLHYMGPDPARAGTPRRFGRSVFGWVLFIGLAIMLFLLLSKQEGTYKKIPLSEFATRFEDKQVEWMSLEDDQIRGKFVSQQMMPDGTAVSVFSTDLPAGMGGNWGFVQWLLQEGRGTTRIQVRSGSNLVTNILVPLIPWLLIFAFIWFFVFRQLRKAGQTTRNQVIITGPGRWVPDGPGEARQT